MNSDGRTVVVPIVSDYFFEKATLEEIFSTCKIISIHVYQRPETFTLTQEEAVNDAKRCLNCGCGEGCSLCATICSEFAIHVKEIDTLEINEEECVACGMCFNRCPNKNIEMINKNIIVK